MKRLSEYMFKLDPVHESMDLFNQPIVTDIWRDKYRYGDEKHPFESFTRVANAIFPNEADEEDRAKVLAAMKAGLWMPGGRIQAGAGTPRNVTLINCYVSNVIGDSLRSDGSSIGIFDSLAKSAYTMQMGGGIGHDFSPLRPKGAKVHRVDSDASGPLTYMDTWDAMCKTIMSAGYRRGAMMATLDIEHPDIEEFITAKHDALRLRNFNMSVLISDAFVEAVNDDADWFTGFIVPPADGSHLYEVEQEDGSTWYAYKQYRARELWEKILKSTYEYAEPGVIFIDRVNDRNNLAYCEDIRATNPCGEQPLPPYGACNLGAINLARMVVDPFSDSPAFDMNLLQTLVKIGVRFLDAVLDVTQYPLPEQKEEALNKRRIGLGISGLGNALQQMKLRYGSPEAVAFTAKIMRAIKNTAYRESVELAKVKGAFPMFKSREFCKSYNVEGLHEDIQDLIKKHGIRNSVLLTIAPTGTTSIFFGYISSGLEPTFLSQSRRFVLQPDGSRKDYIANDYGFEIYKRVRGQAILEEDENYMVTAADLTVMDHMLIQAVCQEHVDSSVSKTINCPKDMTFEDFKQVYDIAYESGCKGCTTYRPSDVRGSVLEAVGASAVNTVEGGLAVRPKELQGKTYQIKWPTLEAALYLTINHDDDNRPFEVFITSKSARFQEWTTALTLMISAIMRKGGDYDFIAQELQQVVSATEHSFVDGRHYSSLVAYIGHILEEHFKHGTFNPVQKGGLTSGPEVQISDFLQLQSQLQAEICPKCNAPTLYNQEGCKTCMNCGFSNCG